MKTRQKIVYGIFAVIIVLLLAACGGSPAPVSAQTVALAPVSAPAASHTDELDAAIRETSDYLNKQLPKGNKLVILNIQSEFPALSEYIIDELIANTVNDRVFSVVDRQQLNTIRAELDFQMSGEVDDATAQTLGRMMGAQMIISGAVSRIGDLYRLRIRALSVQSAQIDGQFNRNIPDSPTVSALIKSKATGYGSTATASSVGSRTTAPVPAPVQAQAAVPTPSPTPVPKKGYEIVNRPLDWIKAKVEAEDRGGHLAVITSAQEQNTIENMIARQGEKKAYWIGGYRDNNNRYVWITNEPMNYTNWAPGEPNAGSQDRMSMYGGGAYFGKWDNEANDLSGSGGSGGNGFIIEWD